MLARTEKPTAKEIAAAVEKSSALARAERDMRAASDAHSAAVVATRAAIAANGDHRRDADVTRLAAAEAETERALKASRQTITPLRTAHGANVAAALRPARESAAAKILETLTDLELELAILTESMLEIERNGGTCIRIPLSPFADIESIARRIAGFKAMETMGEH